MAESALNQSGDVSDPSRKSQVNPDFEAAHHHHQDEDQDPPYPCADYVRFPSPDSTSSREMLEDLPCSHSYDDYKGATSPLETVLWSPGLHDLCEACQESADGCGIHGQLVDHLCSPHEDEMACETPYDGSDNEDDLSEEGETPDYSVNDHSRANGEVGPCHSFSECSSTVSVCTDATSQSEPEAEECDVDVVPVEVRWTDAKHESYLSLMEANFVHNLYNGKYCLVDVCGEAPCPVECEWAASPAEFTWSLGSWISHFQHHTLKHSKHHAPTERSPPLKDISEGEEVDSPVIGISLEASPKAGGCVCGDTEKDANHNTGSVASLGKRGSEPVEEDRPAARQKARSL